MVLRNKLGSLHQDRAAWLVALFLVFGVLVPTASVLWFMNAAAKNQAILARQNLTDAYRGQLRLIRGRIDTYWADRSAALDYNAGAGTPSDFNRIVTTGLADSALLLNPDGTVAYPSAAAAPVSRPVELTDWLGAEAPVAGPNQFEDAARKYAQIAAGESDPSLAAQAAQAQVRFLFKSGDTEAAVRAIQQHFTAGRKMRGLDDSGRLIAADEQLLAVQLMKSNDPRRMAFAARLAGLLSDYDKVRMPAAQRLFLMGELLTQSTGSDVPKLPTYTAERLAAQLLDTGTPQSGNHKLHSTDVSGLWSLTSRSGRVIALYRTQTVLAAMQRLLGEPEASGVKFEITPPGEGTAENSIPAGSVLAGWQISFTGLDSKAFDQVAQRRMASYLWIGYLAVAAIAVTGIILGGSFRRQLRLARLKTDLVSTVSHELRTPICSMRVLVDALLTDPQLDPQKTRDYLELVSHENLRLSRLIENFLTFSRIERHRPNFDFVEVRPADIVQSAISAAQERIGSSSCHVELDISPDLPQIRADESALVTALINLLDNACKYTPSDKRISVRAHHENGNVIFEVIDNGIGIAPEEQKRIFRRFYQVDQRLAREVGGCGLGLSIVEHIVRAHGGSVRVRSQPGRGSTFSLFLPCDSRAKGAHA